ncbi:Ribosome-binding protein 1-like 2, partial [Homarus americanus]
NNEQMNNMEKFDKDNESEGKKETDNLTRRDKCAVKPRIEKMEDREINKGEDISDMQTEDNKWEQKDTGELKSETLGETEDSVEKMHEEILSDEETLNLFLEDDETLNQIKTNSDKDCNPRVEGDTGGTENQEEAEKEIENQEEAEKEIENQEKTEEEIENQEEDGEEIENREKVEKEIENQEEAEKEIENQEKTEEEIENQEEYGEEIENREEVEKEIENQEEAEEEIENQEEAKEEIENQEEAEEEIENQEEAEEEMENQEEAEKEIENQEEAEEKIENQEKEEEEIETQEEEEIENQEEEEIENQEEAEEEIENQEEEAQKEIENQEEAEKEIENQEEAEEEIENQEEDEKEIENQEEAEKEIENQEKAEEEIENQEEDGEEIENREEVEKEIENQEEAEEEIENQEEAKEEIENQEEAEEEIENQEEAEEEMENQEEAEKEIENQEEAEEKIENQEKGEEEVENQEEAEEEIENQEEEEIENQEEEAEKEIENQEEEIENQEEAEKEIENQEEVEKEIENQEEGEEKIENQEETEKDLKNQEEAEEELENQEEAEKEIENQEEAEEEIENQEEEAEKEIENQEEAEKEIENQEETEKEIENQEEAEEEIKTLENTGEGLEEEEEEESRELPKSPVLGRKPIKLYIMTSKTEGRSPVTSRTEEDKVAAVKREEIERCFGFNSDDSMQSNNSNEEDTQSRERYVRSGGDKVSIRLDGDKVSMRSGGDKVSIRLDGDKVSMTSDGDKVSVRSGGDKVSIRSGGDKESVRSGGVKEFIRSGGDKESVRSDGDKESVRSGGVKESIRSGGDKESVRSGGDKVSMRSGGDKESVRSGGVKESVRSGGVKESIRSDGDKESIRSGGDKKGEYISSGVHNKEEENMNLACERSEQDKIFRSQSPAIDDMFCCKDVETEGDLHVTPVASTSSSASHCEVGQPSRDLEQTWKGGHISVASGHRGETKPHTAVQDKTDSDHKDVECIDILSDAADDDEDDDEEETSVASKKATDSDLLYLRLKNLPGKNVPTVCQKCRNIWNDRVLNIISLGTESVTVNSRITYGAIICINNWAESHFSSGKEEAVRSLLDRADLGKNIGSLKISEVNHWLGNIMKSGKIKCCHVFTAVYKPDSTKEFLSNLIGADVTSDVVPVRNNKRDAPVTHEEEIPAKKRISEVKKKTKTKNLNKILRKPLKSTGTLSSSQKVQPSCSKYIPTVSEDVEPASEKIMLSGAWDTPMFAETITMPEVSKEVEAVSLETKKSSSESGPALVSESPVETPPKETVRPVIQSPKMNESDLPEECTPSTSEKSVPLLSKETTPSISKRNKLSLSNNKLQLKLPRHVPPSTKTTALPVSETATLSVSKNVTSPLSENQTSHEPEKDKSNTLSTTETSTTENMETIQPACETTSTTALTENTVTTPIKRTSKLKCHIPKIKTLKPSTSENNRELGASTRQTRSSTSSSQQPPLSQDASDSFPSISSQQDAVAAAVSTVEADNLTKESLVTSHESILSNDDKILTTDTNKPAQAVSQQVVPSTISPQHSLIESQNSTKTIVDTADENSISSDTDIGGEGEEDKSVPSEENTGNNLCAVLGLNVNTLDTYCSSTDMKTITNGDVDLLFRILIQILLTRKRVLLVPNSLTLLLVAENLRRDFNRAKNMTDLSSAGSLNGAEKEVQSAEQKCVTAEKAALQSPDFQKKEELRVNLTIFKEKLSKYKEMNDMMLKRIKLAENRKQEIVNKFVDSKSKKLVQKLSETRRAIHQSLAKRKGDGSMENVENSKKALKVDYTKNIRSSTEICSRERFSSVAASIDLGEDVPQTVREGIYELLANGVDVNQVRTVVHTILTKVGGEESPALP